MAGPGAARTAAVYSKAAAVPAEKDFVVIDVSRYVQELQGQMKMSGSVGISLETPEGANYGAGGFNAISVYNSAYQQDIAADADGYADFADDCQQFIMSHPGVEAAEINRAFLKQFPQYRKQLPQVASPSGALFCYDSSMPPLLWTNAAAMKLTSAMAMR